MTSDPDSPPPAPTTRPRLLVVCGLPGVGKTSVAAALASRTGAAHLSIDVIEDAILGSGLPPSWQVGVAAYEVARASAELALAGGLDVVVDAVNDSEEARATWHRAALAAGAELQVVHLVVSDQAEHERRLSGRDRGFHHVLEPSWRDVLARRDAYAPWDEEPARIDTAGRDLDDVLETLIAVTARPETT